MSVSKFLTEGKVAIVTGGSQGIGKAISLALAEAGATVVVAARHADLGEQVAAQIAATGRGAFALGVDVTKNDQVVQMVEEAKKRLGHIDILVNNAGGNFRPGKVLSMTEEDWDETLALNLKSVFLCSRAVAPIMLKQEKGSIINVASFTAEKPLANFAAYAAAKAGTINLTKSLAIELAPHVRVNAISPGVIDTPRTTKNRTSEEVDRFITRIPLRRIGSPEDVAYLAVYLASDAATWITGTTVDVNGGQLAGWA